MYLSTSRGLSIYDVKNPEKPERLSTLPLPHFENEDVETNGEILLISNDPSEGAGVLYVIDVKDPRSPRPIGQVFTGSAVLPLGPLYGSGHTASCIQDCRYAYLAGTDRGIDIVDLTNPAAPKLAGNFPAEEVAGLATHDVQVDSEGLAWIVGFNGTAAYDTTNPLKPRLVHRTDDSARSKYGVEPTDGKSLNDFIHHNSMRMNNGSLASPPPGADPNAESDTVLVTEEDYTRPTCEGAGQFETWRIGGDGTLRNLDSFVIEVDPTRTGLCSAHYFDERGGLVAQGWYEGGTRFLDVTNPADIKQVGYWIPNKNVTWAAYYPPTDPTGSVVYSIDTTRGVDVLKIDRGQPDTSTPPPGGGTGGGSPQAQGGASPNLRLKVGDRRRAVRKGQKVKYTVDVRNGGRATANGIAVTVDLPTGVARVRGGKRAARGRQIRFAVPQLAPKATKRMKFVAKISRRFRGRSVQISAAATTDGDSDPRNNFYADRNQVKSAKGKRGSSRREAAPPTLAEQTSRMPEVIAPSLGSISGEDAEKWARTFGGICRIALS